VLKSFSGIEDIFLDDESKKIREEVRKFTRSKIEPRVQDVEKQGVFPREAFDMMAEAGLFEIPFSREVGGRGNSHPILDTVIVMEELASCSSSLAALYDVLCFLCGWCLSAYGSEYQKEKYLRPLIKGAKIGSFAATEPDAGSDLLSMRTIAKQQGGKWIINGHKRFISNAPVADFFIVWAKLDKGIGGFILDSDSPGIKTYDPDEKMGSWGQITSDVTFTDVEISEQQLLGKMGDGLKYCLSTLAHGRIGVGAMGIGICQACLDESIKRCYERKAFGKSIGEFELVYAKIVEMALRTIQGRLLVYKAAKLFDQGKEYIEPYASLAKLGGSRAAVECAREAVQVWGAYGYIRRLGYDKSTYKVERLYRDAKKIEVTEGANEVQIMIAARGLMPELLRARQ